MNKVWLGLLLIVVYGATLGALERRTIGAADQRSLLEQMTADAQTKELVIDWQLRGGAKLEPLDLSLLGECYPNLRSLSILVRNKILSERDFATYRATYESMPSLPTLRRLSWPQRLVATSYLGDDGLLKYGQCLSSIIDAINRQPALVDLHLSFNGSTSDVNSYGRHDLAFIAFLERLNGSSVASQLLKLTLVRPPTKVWGDVLSGFSGLRTLDYQSLRTCYSDAYDRAIILSILQLPRLEVFDTSLLGWQRALIGIDGAAFSQLRSITLAVEPGFDLEALGQSFPGVERLCLTRGYDLREYNSSLYCDTASLSFERLAAFPSLKIIEIDFAVTAEQRRQLERLAGRYEVILRQP